jgi:hypothetical protein
MRSLMLAICHHRYLINSLSGDTGESE